MNGALAGAALALLVGPFVALANWRLLPNFPRRTRATMAALVGLLVAVMAATWIGARLLPGDDRVPYGAVPVAVVAQALVGLALLRWGR